MFIEEAARDEAAGHAGIKEQDEALLHGATGHGGDVQSKERHRTVRQDMLDMAGHIAVILLLILFPRRRRIINILPEPQQIF